MPRYRQPYSLTKIGNFIYYRTYDERGERTSPKTTGCRTKGEAHQHMAELIRQGELVPRKVYTLRQWAEERHWWDWER